MKVYSVCFILATCIFAVSFPYSRAKINIINVDNLCYNKRTNYIDLRYELSGVLLSRNHYDVYFSQGCLIHLIPAYKHSVILSIQGYSIMEEDTLTIEDSDGLTMALLGTAQFTEKAFTFRGRISIEYKRNNTSSFQFTYTAARDRPCEDNEILCDNGKCINEVYLCDGYNHCGDRSDERDCGRTRRPTTREGLDQLEVQRLKGNARHVWIAILVLGVVLACAIVVTVLGLLIRCARKKSGTPPQNEVQAVSSSAPTHPLPTPSAPSRESFYGRIRRSLRRGGAANGTRAPEVYQVPSMYPKLDQCAPSPSAHAVDNPQFKIEE